MNTKNYFQQEIENLKQQIENGEIQMNLSYIVKDCFNEITELKKVCNEKKIPLWENLAVIFNDHYKTKINGGDLRKTYCYIKTLNQIS